MREPNYRDKTAVVLKDPLALQAAYDHLRSIAPIEMSFEEYVEALRAVVDGDLDLDAEALEGR